MASIIKEKFLTVLVLLCSLLAAAAGYDYNYCNEPTLDRAILRATTSLPERGPMNARLYENNAWTASSSDFSQYLIIDLKQTMNITFIATQGRAHHNEYVMEYSISYGTNGLDYTDFKEIDGSVKMFRGNKDADTVQLNKFEIPIIAQYIRINPSRWRDRISLRVELYGCEYFPNTFAFNGTSLVRWNLLRDPLETDRHSLRFRFRTNNADGILLYSRGSQGDFFALQIRDNRMLLNIDLGSGIMTNLSVGSLLDDNMWHDVVFSRNRKDVLFLVDRVLINGRIKGEFYRLDLNRAFYIGGVTNKQEGLVVNQNFTGCIDNLFFNQTSMMQEIEDLEAYGENNRYQLLHIARSCPEPAMVPVTFLTSSSFARLKGYEGLPNMNVSFSFRTYEDQGVILYHEFISYGYVKVFLEQSKLIIEIKTSSSPRAIFDNYDGSFSDGKWHQVILILGKNSLILNVDDQHMETVQQMEIVTGYSYYVGGKPGNQRGFIGCMRMIKVNGNYRLPTDWKPKDYCCKNEVIFGACQIIS